MKTTLRAQRRTWLLAIGLIACCRLHAQAAAPPLRYAIDAANGTVHDNRTGLTWQRASAPSTYTWDQAKSYCTTLPLAGGGWRLPRYKEMLTLFDPASDPAIDTTAFPDTTASTTYWSITPYVGTADSAWPLTYGFALGFSSYFLTGTAYHARCVR